MGYICKCKNGTRCDCRTKDGKELASSDRILVVGQDSGVHSVTISAVTKDDEGEYKLTATKDDTSESTSGKLSITSEYLLLCSLLHPSFCFCQHPLYIVKSTKADCDCCTCYLLSVLSNLKEYQM